MVRYQYKNMVYRADSDRLIETLIADRHLTPAARRAPRAHTLGYAVELGIIKKVS